MKKQLRDLLDRRTFLNRAGTGGLAIGFAFSSVEDEIAYATSEVNRLSSPSDLKITDMRVATVRRAPMRCPLIRIDTNQGIYGLGEVRDGAAPEYALFLKSRLLGQNPCNVEKIFKTIKQFGGHARQGGGVSGVEMAMWDLAGKAYGVPVYQMLGGRYRDRIRIYCDTASSPDPAVYAQRMKERMAQGFTFMKMDLGINMIRKIPGTLNLPLQFDWDAYQFTPHALNDVQITDKGIAALAEYIAAVRENVGYEIPLAADHFGHIGVNSCIRLGKALEPFQMAWLEDMVPWQYTDLWKQITDAIDVNTLTGEDMYLKESFKTIIDAHAVDMIHPDLATAGGILETKKIGDYAEEHAVAMAMHFAGTPVSFLANIHCAAATQNFLALEHHSVDVPWWEDLVTGIEKPIVSEGFVKVPETPGLGVELNEEVVKQHLQDDKYFESTDEWNALRSWDRLWS